MVLLSARKDNPKIEVNFGVQTLLVYTISPIEASVRYPNMLCAPLF